MKRTEVLEENENEMVKEIEIPSPEEMTVVNAMRFLYESSEGSGLSDDFFNQSERVLQYAGLMLPVSHLQAVLMSVVLAESQDGGACMADFESHLGLDKFDMLEVKELLNEMVTKGLIKVCSGFRRNSLAYEVTDEFMTCLKEDLPFVEKDLTNMSQADYFEEIAVVLSSAFEAGNDDSRTHEVIINKVNALAGANPEIPFSKVFLNSKDMDAVSKIVLLFWAKELAIKGCRDICLMDTPLNRILTKTDQGHLVRSLRRGVGPLFANGLFSGVKGERDTYRLTDVVAQDFEPVPEDEKESAADSGSDEKSVNVPLMTPDRIVRRELFFNEADKPQVENLRKVMNPQNHKAICERLEKAGLRKGICIILAGESGVGKSELVYQMAAESGRAIMKVDVSSIKDKFIGESEKKLAAVFNEYKALVRKSDVCPVLFLNECDQIMCKRVELSAESSGGDRVDNAIQDMFLEQMESLEGILLLTTNLTCNLDEAYERRILFKVELEKPNALTRLRILKSMMPFVDDNLALELAQSFELSGGQIENISRKAQIMQVIDGVDPTPSQIKDFCQRERFNNKRTAKPISGFGAY